MKILVVTAHPESRSFNFALRNRAAEALRDEGHDLQFSDLYQDGFGAAAGPGDFKAPPGSSPWSLAEAQLHHENYGGFVSEIQREQAKVSWSDLVILQFPIWWGAYPAILKGWIDRVLSYGYAYGRSKTLPPKAALYSVTTGGATDQAEDAAYRDRVDRLAQDVFGYLGWRILPTAIHHGPAAAETQVREEMLDDFERTLRSMLMA